jgi:acyl dehydratase
MTNSSERDELLYLEDLHVGMTATSEMTYLVDEPKIKAFAQEFDPQPFHLDAEAAQQSLLKGLSASGWHTAAITMRLIASIRPRYASGIIGLGAEIAWPKPTRPGDVLRVVAKIMEITPSRSKPDRGVVSLYCETLNQRDEVVQTLKPKLVMFRRAAAPGT